MARITRSAAKDAVDVERERLRDERELTAEYQRWAQQEREAVLAASAAPVAPDRPYVSPEDPLTGPWDAQPGPRCGKCSDYIYYASGDNVWLHKYIEGKSWDHRATYALADVEQTLEMPRQRSQNP
jgi:hypothetical protein